MNHHAYKLQQIFDSKDSKVHAVPHVEETKKITEELKKRRQDLKRAHDFKETE